MNICKNCKYCSYESSINICKHELALLTQKTVDPVSARTTHAIYKDCGTMRFLSNCRIEGVLFEEREDLVYKVVKFFKKAQV